MGNIASWDLEAQRQHPGRAFSPSTSKKHEARMVQDHGWAQPPSPNHRICSYADLVEQLAGHMPHLINVRGPYCRYRYAGDIFCYDRLKSGGHPRLFDSISFRNFQSMSSNTVKRVNELNPDRESNIHHRYILVEDLSTSLINTLGQTFWLNPEFFEEHLHSSGYRAA
jgi:hypothetical protein